MDNEVKNEKYEFLQINGGRKRFCFNGDNRKNFILEKVFSKLAKKLCDRKYCIGADGLILLENSIKADFRMRYYNSDGSYASMCGNGGRSVAMYAYKLGICAKNMKFETDAGLITAFI